MIAPLFAGLLLAATSPSGCPRTPMRVTVEPHPLLPDGVRPTHARVQVVVDVGSDGRVRRAALSESSGDPAVDRAAVTAAQSEQFDAPSFSCITFSTAETQTFTLPSDLLATPAPNAPLPSATPGPVPVCDAPFVTPAGLSPAPHVPRGTVAVDVRLDAAAHVEGARIARSSGNATTDDAALDAARRSGYEFVPFAGCRPAATTYQLEITFR